ncbi:MAG TPA: PAS domain S-box protein [Candidatus Lokiarchaeia archaeon]|nr:PAS domain S-box protein [Candidatus Lokiarchaeia archaeon]
MTTRESDQLEKQIIELKRQYATIMNSNAIGWISIDKNGQILESNQYFQDLLEYDASELQEKTIFDLTFPDDQEITKLLFNELIEGKREYYRNEKKYIKKIGETTCVKVTCCLARDIDGKPDHATCLVEDISIQKQMESELKKHKDNLAELVQQRTLELEKLNQLYSNTIDSIDHVIHVVDRDLKILVANKEFERWVERFNFDKNIVGKTIREAFPFLPPEIESEYEAVFATGIPLITVDDVINNPYNIYTETRKFPVFDGDVVTRVVTSVEDVTESRKAGIALQESEEKFRAITEESSLGIIIVQDFKIKYVNEVACSIMKVDRNQFLDSDIRSAMEYLHPDDVHVFDELLQTMTDESGAFKPTYVMRIQIEPGQEKWIEIFPKMIEYENKLAMLSIINDITEITREKNALKQSEDHLREMLEEEIRKLRNIDQLRTEFVLRASHELKTPLNSVCSATQLLDQFNEDLTEEEKELIDIIRKGGDRLKHLVNDIVDSLRIEAGAMKLKKMHVNLVDLIINIVDQFKFFLDLRRHQMNLDLPESLDIEIDKERIEAVLNNLISNAINNMPPGGEIGIQLRVLGDDVEITIKDSGVGLTDEEKMKLFTKFGKIERYGQGLDLVTEGSGLGLYISKNIVELHGGTIHAESEGRNKGSTFIVILPIKNEEEAQ